MEDSADLNGLRLGFGERAFEQVGDKHPWGHMDTYPFECVQLESRYAVCRNWHKTDQQGIFLSSGRLFRCVDKRFVFGRESETRKHS